jgi:hypothetical protein
MAGLHHSPEPDNGLPIDLLSPGEEHGQSSGNSKKPRNFIATVVSDAMCSVKIYVTDLLRAQLTRTRHVRRVG